MNCRPGFGMTSTSSPTHENWKSFVFPKLGEDSLPTNPLNKKLSPCEVSDGYEWLSPYSDEFATYQCMSLLDHLLGENRKEWGSMILIGHSLGGVIATETLIRYPNVFDALILVGASILSSKPHGTFGKYFFSLIGDLALSIVPYFTPYKGAYFVDMDTCLSDESKYLYRRMFNRNDWKNGLKEMALNV